jgi:hypothetical protein
MNIILLKLYKQPGLLKSLSRLLCSGFIIASLLNCSVVAAELEDNPDDKVSTNKHISKRLRKMPKDEGKNELKEPKIAEAQNQYATEDDIEFVRGKLSRCKKEPPDKYFWNIFFRKERAGKVWIDLMDFPPLGRQASIQIFLNKKNQGKHIGRIAYERACRLSHYDVVYASMRKNNIASYRSAQAAGFREVKNTAFRQRVMKWWRVIK